MGILATLDSIHGWMTRKRGLQIFTAGTRLLLAAGFVPPSLPKILHRPFTYLPESDPVGAYFWALYRTGFYYDFIGWGQITAAVLLLFPRTAHLGALLFLPIIANIFVLTASIGFGGTTVVTGLMLLAVTYLVAWEWDRIRPVIFGDRPEGGLWRGSDRWTLPALFGAAGALVAIAFVRIGVANLHRHSIKTIVGLALGGAAFGFLCSVHHRHMRVGPLRERRE
jgi:hypothetical protein